MRSFWLVIGAAALAAASFPQSCPAASASSSNATLGVCPGDFTLIGAGALEAVHESATAPTGLAVDGNLTLYLAYPRNGGQTPNIVVVATSFTDEAPWPSAAIQNCSAGQDAATCFINVQNVVLDSLGQMWVVDSGIPPGKSAAVAGGAKIMAFNVTTRALIRTLVLPDNVLGHGMNANDLRVNNTAGKGGFAFITDASPSGSLVALDLATGAAVRRLANTSVVRADEGYVGSCSGEPIYCWNGTRRGFCATASDGIALASGNLYWGVLASRRFYYVPQSILTDFSLSDDAVRAAVAVPGELGSEQAGFTADDLGRVYMLATEQNAIYYVDTQQTHKTKENNNNPPVGKDPKTPSNNHNKTLVRSGLIQHADSAAIWDGYLYFCTNQLNQGPSRQYNNTDNRRGPFR